MTHANKIRTTAVFVALAATNFIAALQPAVADARPKTPKQVKLSASDCESLRLLTRDMEKAADKAHEDGDYAVEAQMDANADQLYEEALKGGCRWATWRAAQEEAGIDHVGDTAASPR